MKKIILFLVLSVLFGRLDAQPDFMKEFGIGFLAPEGGAGQLRINFPYARFDLFMKPGGPSVGKIYKKDLLNLMYCFGSSGSEFRTAEADIVCLPGKAYCLKVYGEESGYYKVLLNSTGAGYWISAKELGYLRYNCLRWEAFFPASKMAFYPVAFPGLNLREGPKQESKKLSLMKGKNWVITFTGEITGLWCACKAVRYGSIPCGGSAPGKPLEEYSGWIKISDDTGFPNIWFHEKDCP